MNALQHSSSTITTERVALSMRTRFDPLPSLSPRLLAQYLQQFDCGYLEAAARTFDAMERRDERLASVAAKSKRALSRGGYEVLAVDGLDRAQQAEAQRHKAALDYFYGNCTATNAVREDETGGFALLIRQMADAIGKRYSAHEIVWEARGDGRLTATFRHAPLWFFEATTGRLRFKPQEGVAQGMPLDPDAWLVTVGEGIMEACAVLWMYKHLPLRDWLSYSEKFGMPYLLGKTSAVCNSAEWHAMAEALRGFGSDGAAVIGGADEIVPVTIGGSSESTPYPGLVERADRGMAILWRGADLSTQSHSGSGRGQGASVQSDETTIVDEDRAAWLSESLLPVSRTAIRSIFGEGVRPLAYVKVLTRERREVQLDLAVDTFLLDHGAPMSVAGTLERYGRPMPADGEDRMRSEVADSLATAREENAAATTERAANEEEVRSSELGTRSEERRAEVGAGNEVMAIAPAVEDGMGSGGGIGHADHWFQVSPFGRFPHRVGVQVFDRAAANAIVARFTSARERLARLWRGLPVYIGHPDLEPTRYADHRKYGSIRRLEVRADGLYAQAKWSRAGREIVNDEHFDYPSPLWNMEPIPTDPGAYRPVELISVGLTNRPNINNKPVGANAAPGPDSIDPMTRETILELLDLRPSDKSDKVTDEQLLAAIGELRAAAGQATRLQAELQAANEARDAAVAQFANERRTLIEERLVTGVAPSRTCLTAGLGERNGGSVALTRAARIQVANEAVEARLREADDGDYAGAFAWVRGRRPELFRDMQEPSA